MLTAGTVDGISVVGYEVFRFRLGVLPTDVISLTTAAIDSILTRDWASVTYNPSVHCVLTALQILRNKHIPLSGTLTVYKENGSDVSWTVTIGSDPDAEPIISFTPTT